MLFKPALLLALVTMTFARPNPSSLKTIASATGSKSSIKSPSQKLAEKNSSPSASIVEIPVQSVQGISQTETLSATLQAQDSLQYSHNPVPTVVEHQPPTPIAVAASNIAPETVHAPVVKETIVKESEVPAAAPSVIQNEVVKPASYSNSDAVATIVHTPVVAPVAAPVADQTPVVVEHKPAVVEPVVVEQPTPVVEHKPVAVETPQVVSEKVVPVEKPVVVEHPTSVVEHPVVVNEKPVEHVAPVVVVSRWKFSRCCLGFNLILILKIIKLTVLCLPTTKESPQPVVTRGAVEPIVSEEIVANKVVSHEIPVSSLVCPQLKLDSVNEH